LAAEDYRAGDIKRNPETGAVAVRTAFPTVDGASTREWGVMTVNNGGHYARFSQIEDWPDVIVEGS